MHRPPAAAPASFHRLDAGVALFVFAAVLLIFLASPNSYVGDSKYSLLLSQNLLTRHSLVLDGYVPRANRLVRSGSADLNGKMYQMEWVHDHLYYYFPPGSSLLSVPFVAVMDAFGKPIVDAGGAYNYDNEVYVQCLLASILMAGLAVVFYATGRLLLPVSWSVGVALGGALGTQVWSTASRGLWSHTWGIFLSGGVLYLLLAQATGRHRLRGPLLATVLSWMYFVRPTSSIFIVGITIYLLLFYREVFATYAVTGAAWFVAFVTYSWVNFGKILPSYYQANRLDSKDFLEAFAGNSISPSRGMLVNVPVVFFVVYLLARCWRQQPFPRLVWLAAAMSLGHLAAVSSFRPWFGGACFGPRYTTELVPWLVLVAVLGTRATLDRASLTGAGRVLAWPAKLAGGVLLALSLFINGRGAMASPTMLWNQLPENTDEKPGRVWEWSYPQGLAGILRRSVPDVFPKMVENRISFSGDLARPFEAEGWSSNKQEEFAWSDGHEADLVFALDDTSATRLHLKCGAYLAPPRLLKQHLRIELNGQQVAAVVLRDGNPVRYTFSLPPGSLRAKNVLYFKLPDAISPSTMEHRDDNRQLGMCIWSVEIAP